MARYVILVAKAGNNYSAHVPDVPGVMATGDTIEEVTREMKAALAFHLEGLQLADEDIPEPSSIAEYVDVDAPTATPAP